MNPINKMTEKTAHQLARELLAMPDLPISHFDPSFAHVGDGSESLSIPVAETEIDDKHAFIYLCGTQPEDAEDFAILKRGHPQDAPPPNAVMERLRLIAAQAQIHERVSIDEADLRELLALANNELFA